MGVLDRKLIVCLDNWSCPDCVYIIGWVASVSFVESDEEGGFLSLKDEAIQDQGYELAEVVVSLRDRAVVHVVAHIRGEPHIVRSRTCGAEGVEKVVIWRAFSSRVRRDNMGRTSGRVAPNIGVEKERVGQEVVVP